MNSKIWFIVVILLLCGFTYIVPSDNIGQYCGIRGCVSTGQEIAKNGEYISFNGEWRNSWPDTTTQYMIQTGAQTFTNMPLAATELSGNYRVIGDFTEKDEMRFGLSTAVAGSVGCRAYVQYSIAGNNWFNLSKSDNSVLCNSTGAVVGTWEDLPIVAKIASVQLRVVTFGGDGVTDPQFRGVWVEVR